MNYEVKICECSKDLKARERLFVKDTSDAIKLDEATAEGEIIITPAYYAILGVHNEKADDVDYETYVVVDIAGNKFVTGSDSFSNRSSKFSMKCPVRMKNIVSRFIALRAKTTKANPLSPVQL